MSVSALRAARKLIAWPRTVRVHAVLAQLIPQAVGLAEVFGTLGIHPLVERGIGVEAGEDAKQRLTQSPRLLSLLFREAAKSRLARRNGRTQRD